MILWNNQWVWKHESAWGIINKLEYANQVNDVDLKSEYPNYNNDIRFQDIKTYNMERFEINYQEITAHLGVDIINIQKKSVNDILYPFNLNSFFTSDFKTIYKTNMWFKKELCFCPECIKLGYHSLLHQFIYNNNECFIHKIELNNCCPKCGNLIPYGLSKEFKYPFRCKCGHKLFDLQFDEAYNIWLNPIKISERRVGVNSISSLAIIIPKSIYNREIITPNLRDTVSNIYSDYNKKPNYCFVVQNNKKIADNIDTQDYSNSLNSNTDINIIYWKAIQVAGRHIRRSRKLKDIKKIHKLLNTKLQLHFYDKETIAYFIWVKYSEGVSYINLIHSLYMKQRRRHSYSIGRDEWLPRHIFNELKHLDNLYHKFSADRKLFIFHNVIYRLFILRLLKTYDLILEQVTLDYQEFSNVILEDYYIRFRSDLEDNSSYILELNEDYGNLWCIANDY